MSIIRSLLIAKNGQASALDDAVSSAADVVVLDVTDSLEQAATAITALKNADRRVFVRVGPFGDRTTEELAAVMAAQPGGVILTAAREARDVRQVDVLLRQQETLNKIRAGTTDLLVEVASAKALLGAQAIVAASSRVSGLVLQIKGYLKDLGVLRSADGRELDFARQWLVNVSAAAGVQAMESESANITAAEAKLARSLGVRGKYAAMAAEVETLNATFSDE